MTLLCLCMMLAHGAALAGEPRLMATYGKWHVYTIIEDGHKACYMAAKPEIPAAKKKTAKRGDAYALLTHRPANGERNVFSYIAGYAFKPGEEASLEIDGQKFILFTQGDVAWSPGAEADAKIAKAIKPAKSMILRGVSTKGVKTEDTVSLEGSSAAYNRIGKECR